MGAGNAEFSISSIADLKMEIFTLFFWTPRVG
jgi:hypothetical protein